MARVSRPLADRFWDKVDKNGPVHPILGTPCHDWTATTNDSGYGMIRESAPGPMVLATYVSWMLHGGRALLPGEQILHHCDRPPCCRYDHLFPGTHAVNMADKKAKGRTSRCWGETNGLAKLVNADIPWILRQNAAGVSPKDIAATLHVGAQTVNRVLRGATWSEVVRQYRQAQSVIETGGSQ